VQALHGAHGGGAPQAARANHRADWWASGCTSELLDCASPDVAARAAQAIGADIIMHNIIRGMHAIAQHSRSALTGKDDIMRHFSFRHGSRCMLCHCP